MHAPVGPALQKKADHRQKKDVASSQIPSPAMRASSCRFFTASRDSRPAAVYVTTKPTGTTQIVGNDGNALPAEIKSWPL
jgi:hypothetical protein